MEDEIIEILIDASGFSDAGSELQAFKEAGSEAANSIGKITASAVEGESSLTNFATSVTTSAKSLSSSDPDGTSSLSSTADKVASSMSKSASSALSSALKSVVIDGTSFSDAAATLSSKLASSALNTVSSKMFDSLLNSLMGSFTASSGSSGWLTSLFGFADGGVMTAGGPVDLKAYAGGGIANEPQLALFGEGASSEAFVPLPDGRSIPVTLQGGGGGGPAVNIQMTVAAQDAASFRRSEGQIGATVAAKLQRYMQRYG